jgi:hypothetical protein
MGSPIDTAPVKSSSDTSLISNNTAEPHSVLTVRFTRTILPLTAPNRAGSLPFASAPPVTSKAPTASLTLHRALLSNAGDLQNYLPPTWSSDVWSHSLPRVMCLPIWFLQTDIGSLLTGLILTYPLLLTRHQWLTGFHPVWITV